ncbi:SusC/RagA family TonB-linked outer membrane protein [Bacteroides xylanisolvens]|jgi:TonB-linked SusC/RagA family outer membrane protein|uniref:SusC/RagA family TonB-linked outer membrane protein n=2 Tax=Bacteroides xylanisolvens TaxID=371601 RepID=I9URT6_9BACE|nr:TonB-dependent receptor [Bacteroides xylanisolvens]EIY85446.1 SusC/RagA family TonB-linked outer membrane protein [Bacteroides xylanisolvens CL03T12C04]MBT0705522.1 TonB-dependent receptor P3 [Bacteroides xylanisolvens CL03T12C04]MCA4457914.1 TonB-dependent receptor [Bacteroides xylanisolvens]MCA4462624.1 TonB-dependent receptor [Bacteroides xylanisolvens]MCA4476216.1 TonB-dependent receptor [Bacteroides xylanisolvens]
MRHQSMKLKWMCLLFLSLLLSPPLLWGQNHSIKGQIVDAKSNEPLIGVNITVEGTSNGTISDVDGHFTLTATPDAVLKISYIGYREILLKVADLKKDAIISLEEDSKQLEEVVVVGYGVQKKVTSVGSITQTGGNELMKGGSVNSVSEALQGKLNGVVAINSSGMPGDNEVKMYIRGKSTWDNTDPLVLVDGIERNMNDVDMNEIESISVLKDASATAVYGVRGGNGVILITTKRGTDTAPVINFSANYTFKSPTTSMKLADHVTAMQAYNMAMANDASWDKLIPQSTIDAWSRAYAEGNYGAYNDVFPYVNWWDELITGGFTQNYNINIRGGTDYMKYFASAGYQGDGDIYDLKKNDDFDPRHTYKRYNWRSNFDFNFTKSTKLSINIAGSMGYRNKSIDNDSPFNRILTESTSDHPIMYSDGNWGDDEEKNPVANMNLGGAKLRKTFQGWYDASLEQKLDFITKGLKVAAKVSYSSSSTTNTDVYRGGGSADQALKSIVRYHRVYDYANPVVNTDGTITYPMIEDKRLPTSESVPLPPGVTMWDGLDAYTRRFYYEFSVAYNRSFNDHNVSALALVNRKIYDERYTENNTQYMRFPNYNEDWVGRVTYNWKERYLTEMNISYTGSEKFARGERFGLFPSFSLGWRLSEEPFIKKSIGKVLTNAKFRYSWGKVGSDAGAKRWNYIQQFTSDGNITLGTDASGQIWGPLYHEGDVANLNSTWEKSTKQNLGIEIGLWNKLDITLDLFDEKRKDILMEPQTTSFITGAKFNALNIGSTKNHGFELELHYNDKIGSDFRYHVGFTLASSENRVVFRDDPVNGPDHLKEAGKPIGHQNRYLAVGNYETIDDVFNNAQTGSINSVAPGQVVPGDFIYIDFDSNGILNGQDKVAVDELNYPLHTYGLNLGFDWKGLSFSAMFYAPTGVYKLVNSVYSASFKSGKINAQPDVMNAWTPETANTSGVRAPALHLTNDGAFNGTESTYRYQNFSYLRLKTMELGYNLPKKWLKTVGLKSLQVYVTGNNLLTWWGGDDRIDPEGEQVQYPILRSFTSGVRVSF